MNSVKVGVIWQTHIAAAAESESIDLVAIADLREDVAHVLAGEFGNPTVYGAGESLLDHAGIEAVVLAMPANVRTDLAVKAFAEPGRCRAATAPWPIHRWMWKPMSQQPFSAKRALQSILNVTR